MSINLARLRVAEEIDDMSNPSEKTIEKFFWAMRRDQNISQSWADFRSWAGISEEPKEEERGAENNAICQAAADCSGRSWADIVDLFVADGDLLAARKWMDGETYADEEDIHE